MPAYEQSRGSDDWYTPKYIFDALGVEFDLDVAAPFGGPRYVPAPRWYSFRSLEFPWFGFIWMNAPFGHQRHKRLWLSKFFAHGNGIALVPDRTSAPWWQEYMPQADAVCYLSPKVKFERPDGSIGGSPGTGTALFAAGPLAVRSLINSNLGVVSPRALAA